MRVQERGYKVLRLKIVATDAHVHQELFWVRLNMEPVRINGRRMVLVVPCVQRALILLKGLFGVEGERVRKNSRINPEKLLPPQGKLVYLLRVTLEWPSALGEGYPTVQPRRTVERTE